MGLVHPMLVRPAMELGLINILCQHILQADLLKWNLWRFLQCQFFLRQGWLLSFSSSIRPLNIL